jgi:hypothetical protein
MKLLVTLCSIGAITLGVCAARVGSAQVLPEPRSARLFRDMLSGQPNEAGFTLGEIVDRHLWILARHPLTPDTLNRVGSDVHRAPLPGIQFELLTPGDFGATVHFRW